MSDLLLSTAPDFAAWSADPSRPDWACPAYREMAPRWQLVADARDMGRQASERASIYLPKFEAEDPRDWAARINLTFAEDAYSETLAEHVGLVLATPPALGGDVP